MYYHKYENLKSICVTQKNILLIKKIPRPDKLSKRGIVLKSKNIILQH